MAFLLYLLKTKTLDTLNFKNIDDAKLYFKYPAWDYYISVLLKKGIDVRTIQEMDLYQLSKVKAELLELQLNRMWVVQQTNKFYSQYKFQIADIESKNFPVPITFRSYLADVNEFINERISHLEQSNKVDSIKKLVNELPETEVKDKLAVEIKELEAKKAELEIKQETDREKIQEEMEFGRHKAEMFEKRTNIFLKFLDRESVASIVGSLLLLTMGICLLVVMFRHDEPLKIIESAFLLILGYFFGHSKNNKS